MALNISAWSIRKPIPPLVLFAVLIVVGLVSFRSLPVTQMPNIDVPVVTVTIAQAGAAPSELETQVARPVEDAVAGLTGVKHVTTALTDGAAVVMAEFVLETPTDRAVNDVRDAVAKVRTTLPQSIEEPVIQRIDVAGLPILTYAASIPGMNVEQLSWFVDDTVVRALQSVPGIAQVTRIGGVDREIRVDLRPDRLAALGITASEVNDQLRASNIDLAGGRGTIGVQEQSIRTLAGAATVEELAQRRIALPGGRQALLQDLATVTDGGAEPRSFARVDGKPVVAFSLYRSKGFSDVVVGDAAALRLQQLTMEHPELSITEIDNLVRYTRADYDMTMETLIEGAILAVIVVFLFLRDFRATIISAVAIPLSVLPTFAVMDALGFSLNSISLLAITLATGILVDDAIVEIENIVRHMRMGKSAYRAAIQAADEIGLAVVATTMTIVAVFLPVSFMGGIAGQYFKQFGITVAVAVTFSLLVARLVTPLMAAYLMRDKGHEEARDGWVMRRYLRLLDWSIRHRGRTIAAGLGIFVASAALASLFPTGLLPNNDISRSSLSIELPPGSTLEDTQAVADRVSALLRAQPEVTSVYAVVGSTGVNPLDVAGGEVREATIVATLVPRAERSLDQKAWERTMQAKIAVEPDLRFSFGAGGGSREFTLLLSGNDSAVLEQASLAIEREIRDRVPVLANVVSTAAIDRPEIRIVPRLAEAAALGVSVAQIAETVRIATLGDISANLAKFSSGDRQVPIRVQIAETARGKLATFETLRVPTATGGKVPLTSVAHIGFGEGATTIDRYDRQRRVAIQGDLIGKTPLGEAMTAVLALPSVQALPPGVSIRPFGDAEIMQEVFSGFTLAMGAGVLLVLAVLVLLFADIAQPVTILVSLPLSIGGAFLALLVTGYPISLPVVIGILMLLGIVTKNAILLVDFAIEAIAAGAGRTEALIEAGRKRARPVVMTTLAMIAGMVPSAIGWGEGGAFRSPMASVVIGGLITSTVLSLVFVPAVFTVLDDLNRLFGRVFGRFVGARDEPEPAAPPAE
ncbi:efflux RND transporter permease subunit [Inquilinus sp. CA228]|uniref:efflux RND transporter permease subunit n=1 Tax=Inquilinus sp. CA228 TaxID=3455609 RepID=UPI003F8D2BB5